MNLEFKYIYKLIIALIIIFAASCDKDSSSPGDDGNCADVIGLWLIEQNSTTYGNNCYYEEEGTFNDNANDIVGDDTCTDVDGNLIDGDDWDAVDGSCSYSADISNQTFIVDCNNEEEDCYGEILAFDSFGVYNRTNENQVLLDCGFYECITNSIVRFCKCYNNEDSIVTCPDEFEGEEENCPYELVCEDISISVLSNHMSLTTSSQNQNCSIINSTSFLKIQED